MNTFQEKSNWLLLSDLSITEGPKSPEAQSKVSSYAMSIYPTIQPDNPKPFAGARSDQLVMMIMEKTMTMVMIMAATRGPLVTAGQFIAMH